MSQDEHDIEVSFAGVAAESADQSVAHETDSLDEADPATDDLVDGAESRNDTPPADPGVTSLAAGGPVVDGDALAP